MIAEFRTMLLKIAEDYSWDILEYDDGYKIGVPVGPSRTTVIVRFIEDKDEELWVRYQSDVGPGDILDPEFCLRLNGEERFVTGCVALIGERVVFLDSQLVEDADEREVRLSVRNTARFSVALQKLMADARDGRGTGRYVRHRLLKKGNEAATESGENKMTQEGS